MASELYPPLAATPRIAYPASGTPPRRAGALQAGLRPCTRLAASPGAASTKIIKVCDRTGLVFSRPEADRAISCAGTSNDRVKLKNIGVRPPCNTDLVAAGADKPWASTAPVVVLLHRDPIYLQIEQAEAGLVGMYQNVVHSQLSALLNQPPRSPPLGSYVDRQFSGQPMIKMSVAGTRHMRPPRIARSIGIRDELPSRSPVQAKEHA